MAFSLEASWPAVRRGSASQNPEATFPGHARRADRIMQNNQHIERDFALTLAQLDFWEEFRAHPGEAVSTVAHAIEFSGAVDIEALARAITRTILETDVLALRFTATGDDQPRQHLDEGRRPVLRRIDLSADADPRACAMAMMQADLEAPLDLLTQPIAAEWLIHLGPDHVIWYNRGHHIVLDGYAMGLIESRSARLYAAEVSGTDAGAPFGHFPAYLAEEDAYRASPRHDTDGAHWRQVLSAPPAPMTLTKGSEDYPAEEMSHEESLSDLRAPLLARSAELGIGWPDLLTALCAAWAALHLKDGSVARHDDGTRAGLPVWLPYLSRMGSVAISIPALVVNILPFDVSVEADETVRATLTRLAARLRKLRRHGRYRIEQIGFDHGLGTQERFFFSPLINVLPFDQASFPGCQTQRHVLSNGPGDGFNITIRADSTAQGLELRMDGDPSLTPPKDFREHRISLPEFLREALRDESQDRPISALSRHAEPA